MDIHYVKIKLPGRIMSKQVGSISTREEITSHKVCTRGLPAAAGLSCKRVWNDAYHRVYKGIGDMGGLVSLEKIYCGLFKMYVCGAQTLAGALVFPDWTKVLHALNGWALCSACQAVRYLWRCSCREQQEGKMTNQNKRRVIHVAHNLLVIIFLLKYLSLGEIYGWESFFGQWRC